MKEIFDRHEEKLTAAERHAIWRTVSGSPGQKSRSRLRWGLSTATVALAAVVVTIAVVRQGSEGVRVSGPSPDHALIEVNETSPLAGRMDETGEGNNVSPKASPRGNEFLHVDGTRPLARDLEDRGEREAVDGLGDHQDRKYGEYVTPSAPAPQAEAHKRSDPVSPGAPMAAMPAPKAAGGSTYGRVKGLGYSERKVGPDASQLVLGETISDVPTTAGRSAQPPVIPTTGGAKLPNDEAYDSMFFRNYGVNPFIQTDEDALSTFAVDVDAASYTVTRRYLELGNLPPRDAVRVEEFVNFFPQGYPRFENDDFRILIDGAPSPFGSAGYHLLRIGVKGREIDERDRKPAYLTFVIDVSGSMERENRLELVKQSLRVLVDQLRDDDRVGIVVYGNRGRVLLEPTSLGDSDALAGEYRRRADDVEEGRADDWRAGRRVILDAIELLRPEGSTNAEEGLLLGYDMARRAYWPGAINRLVLCSDGVANVGRTGAESILARARSEADRGIHLSTIGFGMGNYNDVMMEQLANKGDGNYYYVDDLGEARRVLEENLTGTLQTIAKDAKIQVEFDPARVERYRLLGFENRDVADRDFRNDKVDAGEIGAGHEVTALYEVKLAPGAGSGTIATVRLRYARPEHDGRGPAVREISKQFRASSLSRRFDDASPHFRLDAAVAEFAEILRGSYWAKESRMSEVLPVARDAARDLRSNEADEFVTLVEQAARLSETSGE